MGRVLLLLSIAILIAVEAFGQKGRLLGRVLDQDSKPMSAVTVYVVNDNHAQATISNATGYFTFLNIPAGKYKLKAFKRGQPIWERNFSIADAMLRIDVKMSESPELVSKTLDKTITKPIQKPKPKPTVAETKEQQVAQQTQPTKEAEEVEETEEADAKTISDEDVAKDEGLSEAVQSAKTAEASDAAKVDTKPEIIGGMETINRKIIYPEEARTKELQGGVIAKISVDKFGNPTKVVILKATDKMFSEEVFRVFSEDIKFKPATANGQAVASSAVIYVEFKLK